MKEIKRKCVKRLKAILLRPHPGHTGNYTPVPGRRVGRTQMEESRRLVERYLGAYADVWKNIKE